MENIELKLLVKEKLSVSLKTIAKEKDLSKEHLSEEVLERYVADNEDIWTSKVEPLKEKEQCREESKERINQLHGKELAGQSEILDLILSDDIYYHLWLIAEEKMTSLEELSILVLNVFTDDYKELLEEKDKEKKEKKDKEKQRKLIQREKKAQKKDKEKKKRKFHVSSIKKID